VNGEPDASPTELELAVNQEMSLLREEAERQAAEKLAQAEAVAAKMLAEAKREASRLQQEAEAKGFSAGREAGEKAGRAACQAAERKLEQARLSLLEKDKALLAEAEQEVLQLALAVASRVIGQKLSSDDQAVQSSLRQVLRAANGARDVLLQVSPADFDHLWAKRQDWMSSLPGIREFDLKADSGLTKGDLRLISNQGIIDARVETMLDQVTAQLGVELS
jgi:flagellar assembly protein FliH